MHGTRSDNDRTILQRVRVGSNRNNYVHTQRMVDFGFVDAVKEGVFCTVVLTDGTPH